MHSYIVYQMLIIIFSVVYLVSWPNSFPYLSNYEDCSLDLKNDGSSNLQILGSLIFGFGNFQSKAKSIESLTDPQALSSLGQE